MTGRADRLEARLPSQLAQQPRRVVLPHLHFPHGERPRRGDDRARYAARRSQRTRLAIDGLAEAEKGQRRRHRIEVRVLEEQLGSERQEVWPAPARLTEQRSRACQDAFSKSVVG